MVEIALWLWIGLVSLGLGHLVFTLIFKGMRSGATLYAFGLGYGIWVLVLTLMGFAQLYYSSLVWILLILVSFGLVLRYRKSLLKIRLPRRIFHSFREMSFFERFCVSLCFLICLRNFLGALTPEMRHDVLDYHINFPNLYTLHHGFYETPWHVFSYMPSYVETLYTLSLLLSSDILAKLTHFGFSLIGAACIFHVGQRYLNRFSAVWGTLLWLLIPMVSYLTSTAYIDLGVSMWQFLAFACLLRYFEALNLIRPVQEDGVPTGKVESQKWILLCGLFTGWALGSKYTVALLGFAPTLLTLFLLAVPPKRLKGYDFPFREVIRAALILSICGAALVSPWLFRNYFWTGNPVYPFFNSILGLHQSHQLSAEAFMRDHAPYLSDWEAMVEHFSIKIHHLAIDGTLAINLALVLIPLLILRRLLMPHPEESASSANRFLYLSMILYFFWVYFFWVFGTGNLDGRFMMPGYLVLCLLLAEGYRQVFDWFGTVVSSKTIARMLPILLTLTLLGGYIYQMVTFYHDLKESPLPVLSREAQEDYLKRRFRLLEMMRFMETHLPPDSLVLGIGYPLKIPYLSHVKHGVHPIESRTGSEDYSAEALRDALWEEGVTHLVIPGNLSIPDRAASRLLEVGFVPIYRKGEAVLFETPKRETE